MSERGSEPRGPSRQPRTRRKGAPRGGRHGLSRPAPIAEPIEELELVEVAAPTAPTRSRRVRTERPMPTPTISREAEMAYVRADMRKLFVISGALLALMLVILALVGR